MQMQKHGNNLQRGIPSGNVLYGQGGQEAPLPAPNHTEIYPRDRPDERHF